MGDWNSSDDNWVVFWLLVVCLAIFGGGYGCATMVNHNEEVAQTARLAAVEQDRGDRCAQQMRAEKFRMACELTCKSLNAPMTATVVKTDGKPEEWRCGCAPTELRAPELRGTP